MKAPALQYSSLLLKADQRTSDAVPNVTSLNTLTRALNAGKCPLLFIKDVSIAGGQSTPCYYQKGYIDLIIPIAGSLDYVDVNSHVQIVSEHIRYIYHDKDTPYSIENPYKDTTINYLHLCFKIHTPVNIAFPVEHYIGLKQMNGVVSLKLEQLHPEFYGCLGMFEGRSKQHYTLKQQGHGVLVYIINGAFEVENRLMEFRDGLLLWDTEGVEFEALSEHAIILFIEMPLTHY